MFSVFKDINYFAKRWRPLDLFAIFCARILPYLMVLVLLVISLRQKTLYLFFYSILSALLGRLINEFIYIFYKKQRPAFLQQAKVLIPVPKNYSFPSGHASFFFGLSFFLLFYNNFLGIIFIALSAIIGIARVFCGVHWFKDILAGAFVGFLSSLIIYRLVGLL